VKTKLERVAKLFLLSIFLVWFMASSTFGLASQQQESTKSEEFLSQADKYYQKGEYSKAVESYLKAANIAQRKIDLSRAYFGLSLSFFYLRDLTTTEKWIRKVLEVDPKKEISVLFYPRSFVQLFYQVKEKVEKEKIGQVKKPVEIKEQTEKTLLPKRPQAVVSAVESKAKDLENMMGEEKRGNWEIDVHFSLWSADPMMGLFEGRVNEEIEEQLSKEISNQIRENHLSLIKADYEQSIVLDTSGSNYGLEIRFYPKGRGSSFSLGLSIEQTRIKLSFQGQARQDFTDGSYGDADAEGIFETTLFSTNLSFRWDMKPSWRVTPYFVFGFGLAPLKGEFSYSYLGNYNWAGPPESIQDSESKTLKELEEEIDFNIPNIFPILQLNFGVKGEVAPNFYLKAEAGFWNGFLFRGGLAFRF